MEPGGAPKAARATHRRCRPRSVACGLLLLAGCTGQPAERSRLLLVGIDGATWKVIAPLVARGELPAFRQLIAEGACAPELETLPQTISPLIWTTIATGRAPEDHGVTSFVSRLPNGKVIPVSGHERRAPAVWEVADRMGLSSGVVGWWASWPAEPLDGYLVSDHASMALAELLFADRRYWTADRTHLARLGRDVYPADLAATLARFERPHGDLDYAEVARRTALGAGQLTLLRAAPWNQRSVYSWFKTFYRIDRSMVQAAVELARQRPTDLQLVYLRGPDPVQHFGWDLFEPAAYPRPPAHLERDRGLVEAAYRYVDSFLGELLAERSPNDWVMVVSDHGAEPSPEALRGTPGARPGEHGPGAKGILVLRGPGVRRGARLTGAGVYDVMPTAAWLLGLPLSRELPGKPLLTAFDGELVRARPVRTVPTYGKRPARPPMPSVVDERMVESLRSLGYVE